jgi:hypothetical protein
MPGSQLLLRPFRDFFEVCEEYVTSVIGVSQMRLEQNLSET